MRNFASTRTRRASALSASVCAVRFIVLLTYNLLRVLTWPLLAISRALRRRRVRWVRLRLHGQVEELPAQTSRLARLLRGARPRGRTVWAVRRLCDRLATDAEIAGVLLEIEQLEGAQATLTGLRSELLRLTAAGKQIVCHLPVGGDQKALYVASLASRVVAMPHAGFSVLGPLASRTYIAPLLARLGFDMLVIAEGRYKTAAEPLVRDRMSEPEREQLGAIVQSLLDDWRSALASRPSLAGERADALLTRAIFSAAEARTLGAVDGLAYADELPRELALRAGERVIEHDAYLRSAPRPLLLPLRRARRIAILRLVGAIGDRNLGRNAIEQRTTTALLRRVARDDSIAGAILYIDSPGGLALTSELLHREVRLLDQKKPTIAWMGGVAASGGYQLAVACRTIVAQPTTLTGSIGVVSLRPVARRLYERLELRREVVALTPHADLHSPTRVPSEQEQALLRGESERYYERFLELVAEGRRRTRDEIAALAQGRVWSGRDAQTHGLVDRLGGYGEARHALGEFLDLRSVDEEPLVLAPPRKPAPPPLPEAARALLSSGAELEPLLELLALLQSGQRAFAYALDLPSV